MDRAEFVRQVQGQDFPAYHEEQQKAIRAMLIIAYDWGFRAGENSILDQMIMGDVTRRIESEGKQ